MREISIANMIIQEQQVGRRRKIICFQDEVGILRDRSYGLHVLIITHFKSLFTSQIIDNHGCNCLIPCSVTDGHNASLLIPFIKTEVKSALDSMHLDKSPDIDGLNVAFYQRFWSIVGRYITLEYLQIINNCTMPPHFNNTAIILIPKKPNPCIMSDL